jgi:hypothetical protein
MTGVTGPDAYTPGDSDDWELPAPTTVSAALDRLAARVVTEGATGPIE